MDRAEESHSRSVFCMCGISYIDIVVQLIKMLYTCSVYFSLSKSSAVIKVSSPNTSLISFINLMIIITHGLSSSMNELHTFPRHRDFAE